MGTDHIRRLSSRCDDLAEEFLRRNLAGARSYKRIAGYFRSSIFEIVGEEIAAIPEVKIVCNSELDLLDVSVSKYAREAALKERWNAADPALEAALHRERYSRLYQLLTSGRVEVRVVPKNRLFLHGKAGIIELRDSRKVAFVGSANETGPAFTNSYEILWEDASHEGVAWVEAEFNELWRDAYPLPDAIVEQVRRVADRVEVRFEDTRPDEVPAAVLVESPLYLAGEQLQPWQRSFVTMFLQHRETYGGARLLLADEVGLGKTLSLAASAVVSVLLGDGPVLILCPAALTLQWQVELEDKLGVPSAVWSSADKVWRDSQGRVLRGQGPAEVANCPHQIGIVSTGLISRGSAEVQYLLGRPGQYGTVLLDEAHRARRHRSLGNREAEETNLLQFMLDIGVRSKNLLLGTATPIQTEVAELWDLLGILGAGADFVLGRESAYRPWANVDGALPVVKGEVSLGETREVWDWLRNPLPPAAENAVFAKLRLQLGVRDYEFFAGRNFGALDYPTQQAVREALAPTFFRDHNPVIRHTVLRRRHALEDEGLLERIGVNVHPEPGAPATAYSGARFDGLGLLTNYPFEQAYAAAEAFSKALQRRQKGGGLTKAILLQRVCSSFASGKATAERLLRRDRLDESDDGELPASAEEEIKALTPVEASYLQTIVDEFSRPETHDPKLAAVLYFLSEHRTEGKTWLEHGCIIFSQYYDTVFWLGSELAKALTHEPIAVYAGVGRSGVFRDGAFSSLDREAIKSAVKARAIRLVVATDAAGEGLNLQTLGTLINIDLPWNPARLEQRLGRIKRIGQARANVDMLNLVYRGTQDEKVYRALSARIKDRYDLFGGLPDVIDDDWIASEEALDEMLGKYLHMREQAENAFELRYQETISQDANRWETCSRVLARQDVVNRLSEPW
ncbi:MAG: helicase-related protein [Thermaerobacter sp.]|nr:helicase-related protein [Thermaerobacter sp.]